MAFNGKKCIHIRLETNILGIAQSHWLPLLWPLYLGSHKI
jgi:hypothetical protein